MIYPDMICNVRHMHFEYPQWIWRASKPVLAYTWFWGPSNRRSYRPSWSLCAPFIMSLMEFYFITILIMLVGTFLGIIMTILFILNYTFMLFVTK